jgi:zinc metalloprotease ZmpB
MTRLRGTRLRVISVAGALLAVALVSTATLARAADDPFNHTATGTVFDPNPVTQLGLENLTDNKDADDPVFAPAYHQVTLTNLDGSGTLTGAYVTVKSSTGKAAQSVAGAFPAYHRDVDQFEQVMGYYWVNTAQAYLQHLGFGSTLPAVNQRQIELRIDQFGGDNSFFRDDKANITLGKGGVDDAEDAEVIVHEYGHSVQDGQVTGFGTNLESGSIGEGFSDYLSVVVTSWASGVPTLTPEACVADWDSTSYTRTTPHCLRRLDGTKVYPADVVGEVHADGEIWSRALWDIRTALGDVKGTTLIIDAQFDFAPDTSFHAAALATVAAAQRLYGSSAAHTVQAAFAARGIL